MMNRFLKNKKGVTILEGLIALGLLALVAGGTFGVLLSVSRKASNPDIREEMILAVERANEQLQMYHDGKFGNAPSGFENGLCGGDSTPLSSGDKGHTINCMLPAICDRNKSSFEYYVTRNVSLANNLQAADKIAGASDQKTTNISFEITCNGFTL